MPTPKYEREIRSILEKMPTFLGDGPSPRGKAPHRPAPRRSPFTLQGWWARDAYIMAALLTILARWGGRALGSGGAMLLAWLAAALVIVAVGISVIRAFMRPQPAKTWRGNVIDYPSRRLDLHMTNWWRRFNNGRGKGRGRF